MATDPGNPIGTCSEGESGPTKPHQGCWVRQTSTGWVQAGRIGAPTLKLIAMKATILHQDSLLPSLFADVPWRIASSLWDYLGRTRKRALCMWKLFATAYPEQFSRTAQYRFVKIEDVTLTLRGYLAMVKSERMCWRTVLTLKNAFATVPELVEIADLGNLVALDFAIQSNERAQAEEGEKPETPLNDRIVRTWSELAQTKGAFEHLRILRVFYQEDLSKVVPRYLKLFPALQFFIAYSCPQLAGCTAEDLEGWEEFYVRELVVKEPFLSYRTSVGDNVGVDCEPSTVSPKCPILDFQLGNGLYMPRLDTDRSQAKLLCLRRVRPEAGPASKRLKESGSLEAFQKPTGPRRPVMKDRGAKNLNDTLREFL